MESTQNSLRELWITLLVPAWNWFIGLDWSILIAATVLNIALWLARRPLADFLISAAGWVGNAIGIEFNDTVKKALQPSVRALVVVIGVLLAVNLIDPPEVVSDLLEKILNSILVAAVFAAVYAFCDPFAKALEPYRNAQSSIQIDWVIKAMKFLTIFVGVAAVLKIWGIDIGPILTGMGVVGAALALAAQDILKNLLAGITSMGEKRFSIGEWIRVEGVVEGTVEDVDFRSTLIRRFDLA
ncbi:MAG: mechanosensitive ion channel domain-containing protein, partial [Hyphomicrobiales bacterium]